MVGGLGIGGLGAALARAGRAAGPQSGARWPTLSLP